MPSFKNIAIDAISKMMGYDPYLPQTEAMVMAYAEALEAAHLDNVGDVLEAVRIMYSQSGDPGWKPTPKVLVATAIKCRIARKVRELEEQEDEDEAAVEKITLAEFRRRHPEVVFPAFGQPVASE